MTLKYFEGHFSLGCHFHVHFSNPWHAFASHGLPAIAELLVLHSYCVKCMQYNIILCIVYYYEILLYFVYVYSCLYMCTSIVSICAIIYSFSVPC